VLLAPLVFIYGVSFFFTFLDQMKLVVPQLRYVVIAVFVALSCLPMILISTLLAPKTSPVVYPPYYPPDIQNIAGWMKENELMMSDVPWAVAWYGRHQCVWLTLNAQDDFFAINDYLKPVQGALSNARNDGRQIRLRLGALRRTQLGQFHRLWSVAKSNSAGFPLRNSPTGFFARPPVPHGPGTLENNAIDLRRCPPQPVGNARPLRRFRRRFDDDQSRARRVTTVQLRVNRPRKRLGGMRNHAHRAKSSPAGMCVWAMTWQLAICDLRFAICDFRSASLHQLKSSNRAFGA